MSKNKNATANNSSATPARRRPATAKPATSAPAQRAGSAKRRTQAPATSRGQLEPHPVVDQFRKAAVALAEHLCTDWGYASLVIVPPDPGSVGAPPSIVIRIDNPATTIATPTG